VAAVPSGSNWTPPPPPTVRIELSGSAHRKAATCTEHHKHTNTQVPMLRVGFQPKIPMPEQAIKFTALDRTATVTGRKVYFIYLQLIGRS
jgi:hypothetical protein